MLYLINIENIIDIFYYYEKFGHWYNELVKIRGDSCWRDLTCMNYHYQTQPVPNPISYYLHKSPEIVHKAEVVGNHIVELVAPIFIILPFRRLRIASSLCIIGFMGVIGKL